MKKRALFLASDHQEVLDSIDEECSIYCKVYLVIFDP